MLLRLQRYFPHSFSMAAPMPDENSVRIAESPSTIDARLPIELMSRVFELSDNQSCANAAAVCRRWNNAALDELWRSLPSLIPLLELLGPMEDTDLGRDLEPEVILTNSVWDVFKSYAKRVRALEHHDSDETSISNGLVLKIVSAHLGQAVLPNLREVIWGLSIHDTTHQVPFFCSSSLEFLSIQVDGVDISMVKRMLYALSTLSLPRLKTFHISTEYSRGIDALFNEALAKFIQHGEAFLELKLQAIQVTPKGGILLAVSGFSQLRVFEGDLVGFNGTSYRSALEDLASFCPFLERIAVSRGGLISGEDGETLTFGDVEPLLQCRSLEDVRLWGDTLFPFEEEDIRRMGQAWPKLGTLIVGSRAEPEGATGTPLGRLVDFARYLPNLRRFACRFQCLEQIPDASQVTTRFKHLTVLGLEESIVPSENLTAVAEFLAMVCGPGIEFTSSENSWFSDRAFEDRDGFSDLHEWSQVESIIKAIHRAQIGYRRLTMGSGP